MVSPPEESFEDLQLRHVSLVNRQRAHRNFLDQRARRRGFSLREMGLSPYNNTVRGVHPDYLRFSAYGDAFEAWLELRDRIVLWIFSFARMCEEQAERHEGGSRGMTREELHSFHHILQLDFEAQIIMDTPLMAQYTWHTNPWMRPRRTEANGEHVITE